VQKKKKKTEKINTKHKLTKNNTYYLYPVPYNSV